MRDSWSKLPRDSADSAISAWWRDRVRSLSRSWREGDAASLYFGFRLPGRRSVELSAHSDR